MCEQERAMIQLDWKPEPREEAELDCGVRRSMCSLGGITGRTYCFLIWRDRSSVLTLQLGKLRQKAQGLP